MRLAEDQAEQVVGEKGIHNNCYLAFASLS